MPAAVVVRVCNRTQDFIVDAAYRLVRHEPGADVVLFTERSRSSAANIASLLSALLAVADRSTLTKSFDHLSGVGLDRLEE